MATAEEYWGALQARICARCIDGDGGGGCRIAHDADCALKKYLPQLLDVVASVHSTVIEPYEEQLRKNICSGCVHQSATGQCSLRDDVECALDRYFPLIVEVIEELHGRSSGSGTGGSH